MRVRWSKVEEIILEEAHEIHFTIHYDSLTMYQDLRKNYYWLGMKKEVIEYVAGCIICQHTRIENHKSDSLLKPLDIHECKVVCGSIWFDFERI